MSDDGFRSVFLSIFENLDIRPAPGPSQPRAAISRLGFRNKLKISLRDQKWSLDHLACDQSCAGSNKTSFKSPELLCYLLVIF